MAGLFHPTMPPHTGSEELQKALQYVYQEFLRVSQSLDEVKIVQTDAQEDVDIQIAFKLAYSTAYKEFTYNGSGLVTQIDIWQTAAKTTKLFTKTFTYTGSLVDTVTITDELAGQQMVKTFTYSGSSVASITTVIT